MSAHSLVFGFQWKWDLLLRSRPFAVYYLQLQHDVNVFNFLTSYPSHHTSEPAGCVLIENDCCSSQWELQCLDFRGVTPSNILGEKTFCFHRLWKKLHALYFFCHTKHCWREEVMRVDNFLLIKSRTQAALHPHTTSSAPSFVSSSVSGSVIRSLRGKEEDQSWCQQLSARLSL